MCLVFEVQYLSFLCYGLSVAYKLFWTVYLTFGPVSGHLYSTVEPEAPKLSIFKQLFNFMFYQRPCVHTGSWQDVPTTIMKSIKNFKFVTLQFVYNSTYFTGVGCTLMKISGKFTRLSPFETNLATVQQIDLFTFGSDVLVCLSLV
jgi:hypothetical protein